MSAGSILDNDIILKVAAFRLVDFFCGALARICGPLIAVAALQYIVPKQMARSKRISDHVHAADQITVLFRCIELIEPTVKEIEFAANLEETARRLSLDLDAGESLCLSLLILRNERYLLTGDKRAIVAIESLKGESNLAVNGQVVCLEQVLATAIEHIEFNGLRGDICRERDFDTTARLCFSCSSNTTAEKASEGLKSYISALRAKAPTTLYVGYTL